MLSATDALTTGFARPGATTPTPTPARTMFDDLDTAARRALCVQPLVSLPIHLYAAFELLGDAPTAAHERAQSVISDQKRIEGVGVQDDTDVSVARAKLAYAAEEYARAVDAALGRYAALDVQGFWKTAVPAPTSAPVTPTPDDNR